MFQTAVIGGGAAGLMAARAAALAQKKRGKPVSVILIEGNSRVGKKLLATGNGRCNLSNVEISPSHYHGDRQAAARILSDYPAERIRKEFEKMGLLTFSDGEGRIYPKSQQAASVLYALRFACEEAGVETQCNFAVDFLTKQGEGFLLRSETGEIKAKACVLASGGMASPSHSCSVNGYSLARGMGHSLVKCRPSLVALPSGSRLIKPLKGMRVKALAALYAEGHKWGEERGEVLFGDDALSGICIFNLSSLWGEWLREGRPVSQVEIALDLAPDLSREEVEQYLRRLRKNHPDFPAGEMLFGLLNQRVGQVLLKSLGIERSMPVSELPPPAIKKCSFAVKNMRFPVTAPGSFRQAQVTAGGVPMDEVDWNTMGSKRCPGLYLAGELLNVDGDCGGYNLHWAWATGLRAGESAGNMAL